MIKAFYIPDPFVLDSKFIRDYLTQKLGRPPRKAETRAERWLRLKRRLCKDIKDGSVHIPRYADAYPRAGWTTYWEYAAKVREVTEEQPLHLLPDIEKRGREYHLDHVLGIMAGWQQNIHPEVVGHISNLRIIHRSENASKGGKETYTNLFNVEGPGVSRKPIPIGPKALRYTIDPPWGAVRDQWFTVRRNYSRIVAFLSEEQLREALKKYDMRAEQPPNDQRQAQG